MKALITAAGAALVAAAVAGTALAVGMPGSNDRTAVTRAQLAGVNFIESCTFSHRLPDDPIVFPGKPGLSHNHTFVGNTTTSASSTYSSLRAGGTTCKNKGDTAAYWAPTLFQGTTPVLPMKATIYYRRGTLGPVHTFPRGLKMIAGNSMAMTPQSLKTVFWNCGVNVVSVRPSSVPQVCPSVRGSDLRLHIRFPECWDGHSLDSADHKSHMAYAMKNRCPASHPVSVPQITLIYTYPIQGVDNLSLASGGVLSGHADFFNGWNPGRLQSLIGRCLNALVHCGQTK